MRYITELILAVACIIAPQLYFRSVAQYGSRESVSTPLNVNGLPMTLGKWTGEDVKLDPKLFDALEGLNAASRTYRDHLRNEVQVSLVTYQVPRDLGLPHPALVCYPANGWTISATEWRPLSKNTRYQLYTVEQDGQYATVANWYQLQDQCISERDELRRLMRPLLWQSLPLPTMVKVLLHVPGDAAQPEAKAAIDDLAKQISEWIAASTRE